MRSAVGILAPAKTPSPIVQRLYDETAKIVNGAEMKNFILSQGAEPALLDPGAFASFIKAETAKWARVVKAAHVKPIETQHFVNGENSVHIRSRIAARQKSGAA